LRAVVRHPEHLLLLGIAPEEADPELGYIQPGAAVGSDVFRVASFIEKPPAPVAETLCRSGGMWNSFIMAAEGQTLLDLYANGYPEVVLAMIEGIRADRSGAGRGLRRLYDYLPDIDFSRHVLTGAEERLRLLPVAACGWSDLGTPARVARTLQRLPSRRRQTPGPTLPFVNLASAQLRLQATA
jgi:mannose-1-phosphate guanylyltransferase